MKRFKFIFIFTLLMLCQSAWAKTGSPIGLMDCYELALNRSTTIAISDEDILQARDRYLQALGEVAPKLFLTASETLQDTSHLSATNPVNSNFHTSQPEVAFTATVPLFQGLKEVGALRAAGSDRALQRDALQNAKRLLFQDVAQAFYGVLAIERDISRTAEMIRVYRARLNEISERVRLGKSRESEKATQETELAILDAELASLRGERDVAYDMMSFLTGLTPHPPLAEKKDDHKMLMTLNEYLSHVTDRPDVRAAKEQAQIAHSDALSLYSGVLPQVSFQSDYYPHRSGFQKDIKWDAMFNLSVPIFNLQAVGELKESSSKAKQSDIRVEAARRTAESEMRRNYDSYRSTQSQLSKYETAVRKASGTYFLLRQEYALGLVTNLDVLQAQKTWLDVMRERDKAFVSERLSFVTLQTSAGVLP